MIRGETAELDTAPNQQKRQKKEDLQCLYSVAALSLKPFYISGEQNLGDKRHGSSDKATVHNWTAQQIYQESTRSSTEYWLYKKKMISD